MKKEELTAIGLTDEQADKVFAINGKDVEKLKNEVQSYKAKVADLEGQLGERDRRLDELGKVDAKSLQAEIEKLKGENAKLKEDGRLDAELYAQGVKDAPFVRSLLDRERFEMDGEKITNLPDLLAEVQQKIASAFPAGTTADVTSAVRPAGGAASQNNQDVSKMTYSEMVAYQQQHPGVKI